jgi:hypothetical protein
MIIKRINFFDKYEVLNPIIDKISLNISVTHH